MFGYVIRVLIVSLVLFAAHEHHVLEEVSHAIAFFWIIEAPNVDCEGHIRNRVCLVIVSLIFVNRLLDYEDFELILECK